ncbi:MAG: response regulator [Flavobacteriaceae bacterium]|nr:response regulator [Flavobacteriaceae bacterium]
MHKNEINLLIIEDDSISAEAYANIVNTIPNIAFSICFAKNCDEAVKQIKHKKFHVVLLDLQLLVSKNERYVCGEDLGLLIRKTHTKTKIVVLTNITDPLRVRSIIEEINPEGFIIKTDIRPQSLIDAIVIVLSNEIYYSKTIKAYSNKVNLNGIVIDDFDRQILYHLSMGEKLKDIPKFVALSKRAIEERKTKLKTLFDVKKGNNYNLVKAAKMAGFI